MTSPVQQFTRDVLSRHGALVDPAGDDALDVVASLDLQARLGLADYQRLVFSPDATGPGQLVDYDSPLLEQMGRLVDTTGRVALVRGPFRSSKSVDAEREISRAVSLQNGVYRVQGLAAADVIDFGFVFEYNLLADERTSGLVQVWINPATRSVPRLDSWFGTAEIADDEQELASGEAVDVPWTLAIGAAHAALGASIDEFVLSLTRRRDRDVVRIRDYYEEIDREIRHKLTRARTSEEARRRELPGAPRGRRRACPRPHSAGADRGVRLPDADLADLRPPQAPYRHGRRPVFVEPHRRPRGAPGLRWL